MVDQDTVQINILILSLVFFAVTILNSVLDYNKAFDLFKHFFIIFFNIP